ncbi:MAG: FkbM family methyltransferase [Dysgonomonas sp.]
MKEFIKKIAGQKSVMLYRRYNDSKIVRRDKRLYREYEKDNYKARLKMYSSLIKPGDLVFDVGANIGNRVAPLLKVGANIIAIEPQEACYTILKKKFKDKITIVTKGVDAKPGSKKFYISTKSTPLSSFSEEWVDSMKANRFQSEKWDKSEEVDMTTLDLLVKKYGKPVFIKIDVEGYEAEVLKGLTHSVKYLSFEYTVPEYPDKAIECVNRLNDINGNVKFNYSIGESMEWALSEWLTGVEMKKHIESSEFLNTIFGDIYAHNSL